MCVIISVYQAKNIIPDHNFDCFWKREKTYENLYSEFSGVCCVQPTIICRTDEPRPSWLKRFAYCVEVFQML